MRVLVVAGFQFDHVFDWTILKYQQADFASPNALVSKLNFFYLMQLLFYYLALR